MLERSIRKSNDHGWSGTLFGGGSLHCVFLTCFEWDFLFFSTMLRYSGVRLYRAETLDEADFLLTVTESTVLLCDVAFLDGCWLQAVQMLSHVHPKVPCLLVADLADQPFVSDATNRGAFGVIWRPLQVSSLRRLIEGADRVARERGAHSPAALQKV
jgi:DNA-binding NtrC family response regulator